MNNIKKIIIYKIQRIKGAVKSWWKTRVTYSRKVINKLEEELEYLKAVKRKEVAERLKVAISFGDLSENAEYDEAKNEQAKLEEQILKLDEKLRKAVIIDESQIDLNIVTVGSIVKVFDFDFDEEVEYVIVGSAEADPFEGKISNESPVGKALLGARVAKQLKFKYQTVLVNSKFQK